jgi:1-aminocyclopropane-1-carboxylate deaminase
MNLYQEPIIQEISLDENPKKARLFIKREDLIHPVISGNKWRKLKYNLKEAEKQAAKTLLTFGGAYSNHIHAVAGAAKKYNFKSIGLIRGEEHLPLNPTLEAALKFGMELHYIDRAAYRKKDDAEFIEALRDKYGSFYLIPEGGTNEIAIRGAAEIVTTLQEPYDYVLLACGTAGTATGVITGLEDKAKTIGISVLKGDFHTGIINGWLQRLDLQYLSYWEINNDYHFGGYAKFDSTLVEFINAFKHKHNVPLDPVYTGKALFAAVDMIAKGLFPSRARVLAIHTGGLQGVKGFNERFNNIIDI